MLSTRMNVFAYVLIGIGILLALAFIGIVLYLIYNALYNRFSPKQRVAAVVARKNHRQHALEYPDESCGYEEGTLSESVDCYATFVFNGQSKELWVPKDMWVNLSEGDEGLLIYRGDSLKMFIAGVKDRV